MCPCRSEKGYAACCEPFAVLLPRREDLVETVFTAWMDRYSLAIQHSFRERASSFVHRLSIYADVVFDCLCPIGFKPHREHQERLDEAVRAVKHNITLSLFASLSCLAQGLFLQSGALIRCCIEDSLVLLDIFENEEQLERFLSGKYSTSNVLRRVRQCIPHQFMRWYGHYSANFAHFGPFHSAPYVPRACYPENYVLGSGLENVLLATYMCHVVLERAHFDQMPVSFFWKSRGGKLQFEEENNITRFVEKVADAILVAFPSNEKKEGYSYGNRQYYAK